MDDLPLFIGIESDFLEYTGTEILTAKDGYEALDIIRKRPPDLVFMDLEMPRMDGATCCQMIRGDATTVNLPVIMITSRGNEAKCFSAGCDDVLTKPLSRDLFLSAARTFIPDINRREKRVVRDIVCDVTFNGETRSCRLLNVSNSGAFVITDFFGKPGNVVHVSFVLPTTRSRIECSGKIAWINVFASRHPKGFGVKFSLMNNDAKSALKDFMDSCPSN